MLCAVILLRLLPLFAQLRDITINYPAKAPANWPLFLAKEGGYYQKYGLDAKLVFAVHPGGHGDAGERRSADDELPDGSGHAGGHAGWRRW